MPRTPTSPTLRLCDQLVAYLLAQWTPVAPANARRAYLHWMKLATSEGRQVVIFPVGYTNIPAERGHDVYTHTIRAVVFEKYQDAADPSVVVPSEWVDERVDFVNTYIAEGFDFTHDTTSHGGTAPFNVNLQTLSTDVPDVFDADKLATGKEFWCVVDCVFNELILS